MPETLGNGTYGSIPCCLSAPTFFYVQQLASKLQRVLAMVILSIRSSVCLSWPSTNSSPDWI